jgi:hypothetical protein
VKNTSLETKFPRLSAREIFSSLDWYFFLANTLPNTIYLLKKNVMQVHQIQHTLTTNQATICATFHLHFLTKIHIKEGLVLAGVNYTLPQVFIVLLQNMLTCTNFTENYI